MATSNIFSLDASSTRYKGVNIRMQSNGDMVISVLGNMMNQYEWYVREVLNKSQDIVTDVAYRHFMGLSKSKGKNSFLRTGDDSGNLTDFVSSSKALKGNIVIGWQPAQKYMKQVWSDKLWDYYEVPDVRGAPQTVNLMLNTYDFPVIGFYVFGTQAHWIYPSKKKALAFFWQKHNRFIYAKHVAHPGAKPHPQVLSEINRKSIRRIKEMVRKARVTHGIGLSKLQRLGFGKFW